MNLLAHLNSQQQIAVTAPSGPVLVLAGPGSGKTRVLSYRIVYLINSGTASPDELLAVTFTNKAAREMGCRVRQLLGSTPISSPGANRVQLGTFHSICARILRREADHLPFTREYVIFDDADQQAVIRQALKQIGQDPKQAQPTRLHAMISRAKNELIDAASFTADTYFNEIARRVYERYQSLLLQNNGLDFDDLLFWAVRLLRENPAIQVQYQLRYPHILVDEFQDTNTAQYELLKLLTSDSPDIFVVGDPDQSIYRWRGADYRNVRRFQRDFPQSRTILLEQNYRSTQNILDAAMAVINRNPDREAKQLFTERGRGDPIVLHETYDEVSEASFVVDLIAEMTRLGEADPGEVAIMYRTNAQSRALEEAFLRRGLPYQLVGAQRFYGRREVKDIIAYLRLIHNPADNVSLLRVLNTPARGIGAKTVSALLDEAAARDSTASALLLEGGSQDKTDIPATIHARGIRSLADFGKQLKKWILLNQEHDLLRVIDTVLEDIGYRGYITDGTEEGEERWANVLELRSVAAEFNDVGMTTFLEQVALVSDQDTLSDSLNAPTLLTLHASKGLEFKAVIIIGLDEGVLPHQRSFNDAEEMAEERRLMYVGITRAMDRLYLLHAFRRRVAGTSSLSEPSRFLEDIPPDLVHGDHPNRLGWDQVSYRQTTDWGQTEIIRREASYASGMRVRHKSFGEGIVIESKIDFDDEEVTVAFESGETRHLVASLANLEILHDDPA